MESHHLGHIEFANAPPDYLRCMICQSVLNDPVQIMTCGHHYCQNCFQRVKGYAIVYNSELRCPVDQSVVDLSKVFRDLSIARVIRSLHVKCQFSERGCPWVGELGDLEAHKNKCQHLLNQTSLTINELPSEVLNVPCLSAESLQGLIDRLGQCESGLVNNDKELAHIRFQLKETTEVLSQKDEEIENLKRRIIKCEEENVSKAKELARLRSQRGEQGDISKMQTELQILDQKILDCKQEYAADVISYQICINEIEKLKTDKIGENEITKITKDIHGLKTEVKSFKAKLSTNEADSHDDVMFIPNFRHKKLKPQLKKPDTDSNPDSSLKPTIDTCNAKQNLGEISKKKRPRTVKKHIEQPKESSDTSKPKSSNGGRQRSKAERLVKFDVVSRDDKRELKPKLVANKLKMGGGASWSCPVLNVLDPKEMGPDWSCQSCGLPNRADVVECSSCGAWVL